LPWSESIIKTTNGGLGGLAVLAVFLTMPGTH